MLTWDIENRKHRPSSASSFTVAQKKSRTVVSRSSIISCPIWPSPSRPRLHRRELRYTHTEPALLCRITLGCKHMPAESTEIETALPANTSHFLVASQIDAPSFFKNLAPHK